MNLFSSRCICKTFDVNRLRINHTKILFSFITAYMDKSKSKPAAAEGELIESRWMQIKEACENDKEGTNKGLI